MIRNPAVDKQLPKASPGLEKALCFIAGRFVGTDPDRPPGYVLTHRGSTGIMVLRDTNHRQFKIEITQVSGIE